MTMTLSAEKLLINIRVVHMMVKRFILNVPTCYGHPGIERVVGGLLVKLGRHGRLATRAVQGTLVPGAAETGRARGTSSSGRSRAGSRISSDQTYA